MVTAIEHEPAPAERRRAARAFVRDLVARPLPEMPVVGECTIEQLGRYAIHKTLQVTEGSTHRTAAILGISVRGLQYHLERWRAEGW